MSSVLMAMGPKIMGLWATKTEELLVATDKLLTSFVKSTGANEAFRQSVVGSMDSLRMMGLSMEHAGTAAAALYAETVSFKDASQEAQESMITFVATLEQAGVSAQSTSQAINILSKTLNITGKQAQVEASRLLTLATSLHMTHQQVMSDFTQASSVIAAHGSNIMNVFSELESASRATSLSMGELLGIAAQFDTFDSSAQSVGRLNSILGGQYLNSIEMVYASESERIRAMLMALELSGQSFESMSRLERRAFAAAAGITDMAQAQKLFGGGLSAYDNATAKSKLQAAEQEKLNKIAKDATALFQNLQNAMTQLAVSLGPVLELFRGMVNVLSTILGAFDGLVGVTLSYAILASKALIPAIVGTIRQMFYQTQTIAGLTISTWKFAAAQTVANHLTKFGSRYMILFALAATAVHLALTQPGSPPLYIALMIVAAGIFLLGRASETSAIGLLAAGAGVALIGAGVWLAGLGVEFMANAFVTLFSAVADNLSGFAMFAGILSVLLPTIAIFGIPAAIGLAAIGTALLTMGPLAALGIAAIAGSIHLLAEAINSIDKDVMISFKAFTS